VLLIIIVAEPVVMTFAVLLLYVLSGPVDFVVTWPRRRRLEKAVHKGREVSNREGDAP
jgi:CDP-diacylglycerol--serine O-phosphatidyltransferase